MLCIGQNELETKELSHLRKLCWTIVCGYADHKKLPANEQAWWPLGNDPIIKPPGKRYFLKLHNKISSLKKVNKNG